MVDKNAADIIVVGGGAAGLSAAIEAARAGKRVILLEKNGALGGTSSWAVGAITATRTPHQRAVGIVDGPDGHFEDMEACAGPLAPRDNTMLRRILVEGSTEIIPWLMSLGLVFLGPMPEPPHRHPRMHNVVPSARAFAYPWADAAAALVVAVFICLAGWRLGRRTIDTLLDTAPAGVAERLTAIASRVPGVVAVERVRARSVGRDLFVELTAGMSRTLPIDRVAAIKARIISTIQEQIPQSEIIVTIEPRALDDETVMQRVNVIARSRALAVHHVTVHNLKEKLSISLDLEVDGDLALRDAHDIADGLENAINEELGAEVEIDTHIEPLQPDEMSGRDASQSRTREIEEALGGFAAQIGTIRQVHDVRVRETEDGEIVNFHCRVDPARTVYEVHEQVDDLERALRARWPAIKRVIGHAEPLADPNQDTPAIRRA